MTSIKQKFRGHKINKNSTEKHVFLLKNNNITVAIK